MHHTLTLPAQFSQLAAARRFVEETGALLGLPRSVTEPLALAVDESLSNVVQHGYHDTVGMVEIEMKRRADAVVVSLRDQGPPFDPTSLPDPDITLPLNQRPVGGLGVYLTRRSVDSVAYERTAAGDNQLTLTKKVAAA